MVRGVQSVDQSTAYDGHSREPQRRELTPLERDLVCRAIRSEITRLLVPYPDDDSVPSFLRGLQPDLDSPEVRMLSAAFHALTPRPVVDGVIL